jgi:hypothetical protein
MRTPLALVALAVVMLVIVACTKADEPRHESTFIPEPTTQPPATTAPDPTATTTPPTGGNTPLAPTATTTPPPPATQPPAPTATPASPPPPAPTVVPTATPDPLVILQSILAGEVEPNRYPVVAPGDGELLERLFPEAPPYAPHTIGNIEITVNRNRCSECHQYGLSIGGKISPIIPISHFTDAQTLAVSEELDPRRYICTSCHVAQVTDPLPYPQ